MHKTLAPGLERFISWYNLAHLVIKGVRLEKAKGQTELIERGFSFYTVSL